MRARPVKITPSTFHGFCPKGKQKANCGGFSFSIPANFVNGWSWGSALYRDYSALSKDKQASSGLCFDALSSLSTASTGKSSSTWSRTCLPTLGDVRVRRQQP